jgi:replicative DNA helicase
VDDSSILHVRELVNRARLYKRRLSIKLVVDYLRLVEADGREVRHQAANVAAALRALAKKEQLGVVLLSQLRRPAGGENTEPTMLELEESGDIEAHAHVVLLLHQPKANAQFTHEDEIIIGKQREGPIGKVLVEFDTKTLQFKRRTVPAVV